MADALPALAGAASRTARSAPTTSCGSGRSTTSTPSGARSGTSSTCRPTARPSACSARARDAGRGVVPGRRAQLRRARLPRQATTTRRDPPRRRGARAGGDDVGRAAHADGANRGRTARAGRRRAATASSRTCRTSPRRSRRCSRARRSGRCGRAARPTSARASVVDRFAQIEPTVLLAVDGYRYGGRDVRPPRGRRRAARADADAARHRPAALPRPRCDARRTAPRVGRLPRTRPTPS